MGASTGQGGGETDPAMDDRSMAFSGHRRKLSLLVLALPLLWLLPGIGGFPYPGSQADFSDLAITHYPNAVFLKHSLREFGELPLWSPLILSGYPFAANPLAGLWYPPAWLALLFPLPFGLNLLAVLHLLFGGVGVYELSRQEGAEHAGALLAGLAFVALPKLSAHFGAGHLTLVYAVPWTPWLLYWQGRERRPGSPRVGGLIRPGLVLGLIALADLRWAAYAGLAWLAYAVLRRRPVRQPGDQTAVAGNGPSSFWRLARSLVAQLLLAAVVAAPLALPFLEYLRLSSRNALTAAEALVYSLPPARLLGLIFPDTGGFQEWVIYPGGVITLLALLGALWRPYGQRSRFWIGLFLAALLWALGQNLPWNASVAQLPGIGLLRVPARGLFLAGLAVAMLAGQSFSQLRSGQTAVQKSRANLAVAGLVFLGASFVLAVRLISGFWAPDFIWGALVLVLAASGILVTINRRAPSPFWLWALVAVSLVDWGVLGMSVVTFRDRQVVLGEQRAVVAYLNSIPGRYRVYSPSYSLPQQVGAQNMLEQADGVDPLQLEAYARFMEAATGVPRQAYSVTLPPFDGADPSRANQAYLPDPELLGWLNVRILLAEHELDVVGLEKLGQIGSTHIYENLRARPRAWVQPAPSISPTGWQGVPLVSWTPNKIILTATGPGTLVVSEVAYPGWQARVDGRPADMVAIEGLLRGVPLPDGPHQVVLSFRPIPLYIGLGVWVVAGALVIVRLVLSGFHVHPRQD